MIAQQNCSGMYKNVLKPNRENQSGGNDHTVIYRQRAQD